MSELYYGGDLNYFILLKRVIHMNERINLSYFPPEIRYTIFDNLLLNELVTLRLVCKSYNELVYNYISSLDAARLLPTLEPLSTPQFMILIRHLAIIMSDDSLQKLIMLMKAEANISKGNDGESKLIYSDIMRLKVNLTQANATTKHKEDIIELIANRHGICCEALDLSGINLSGTNMESCDLYQFNFTGANLSSVDLSNANLSLACLDNADLRHSNLNTAILIGVSFQNTQLSGATMEGIELIDQESLLTLETFKCDFDRVTQQIGDFNDNMVSAQLTNAFLADLYKKISSSNITDNILIPMIDEILSQHKPGQKIGLFVSGHVYNTNKLITKFVELRTKLSVEIVNDPKQLKIL